jgi:hypothetical protein
MRDLLSSPGGRESENLVAEIKSALELALEKAERLGKATQEEIAESQYKEQGCHLAVQYLKGEGDLEADLKSLPAQVQPAARMAIKEVLLRNIGLPRDGELDPRMVKALEGMLLVASNRKAMERLKTELDQILKNFLQVRNSAYQQLKARFGASVGNMQRALEAQLRQKVRVDVELVPQFQEEWRRFQASLYDQFEPLLEDVKDKMLNF